jgi:hypothetical protein
VAITRRPKSSAEAAEVSVETLINKGGSSPKRDAADAGGTVAIVLRLPTAILARVEQAVKARPIRTPRHTWLLEAVHEKLTREEM